MRPSRDCADVVIGAAELGARDPAKYRNAISKPNNEAREINGREDPLRHEGDDAASAPDRRCE